RQTLDRNGGCLGGLKRWEGLLDLGELPGALRGGAEAGADLLGRRPDVAEVDLLRRMRRDVRHLREGVLDVLAVQPGTYPLPEGVVRRPSRRRGRLTLEPGADPGPELLLGRHGLHPLGEEADNLVLGRLGALELPQLGCRCIDLRVEVWSPGLLGLGGLGRLWRLRLLSGLQRFDGVLGDGLEFLPVVRICHQVGVGGGPVQRRLEPPRCSLGRLVRRDVHLALDPHVVGDRLRLRQEGLVREHLATLSDLRVRPGRGLAARYPGLLPHLALALVGANLRKGTRGRLAPDHLLHAVQALGREPARHPAPSLPDHLRVLKLGIKLGRQPALGRRRLPHRRQGCDGLRGGVGLVDGLLEVELALLLRQELLVPLVGSPLLEPARDGWAQTQAGLGGVHQKGLERVRHGSPQPIRPLARPEARPEAALPPMPNSAPSTSFSLMLSSYSCCRRIIACVYWSSMAAIRSASDSAAARSSADNMPLSAIRAFSRRRLAHSLRAWKFSSSAVSRALALVA